MNMQLFKFKSVQLLTTLGFVILAWFWFASLAQAASFSVTPSSGEHAVGTTFEVSVLLDTKGQTINAVQMELSYPPDRLQLVSPSAGNSVIQIYTTPPRYDNNQGRVEIIGGIPNGINVNNGLVTKLTFRVRSVGPASLRFTGQSQILLNDGRGTNVLDNTFGATYNLVLPPQQGPIVVSDTHPDQEIWYRERRVNLQWDIGLPPADGYSYTISSNPDDVPDDISDTSDTRITYNSVPEGINYFHIKALRDGRWGGVSHYSLKIDTVPPAEFTLEVLPGPRTYVTKPIIEFQTTDGSSGIERYEIKIITLKTAGRNQAIVEDQLFIETGSPFQTVELLPGTYEVIVRAYDNAGNFTEVSQKLEITDSWFWFLSQDGITLPNGQLISWWVIFPLLLLLLLLLLLIAYITRRWYKLAHEKVENNHLPESLSVQLQELEQYRNRYGRITGVILLSLFAGFNLFSSTPLAQAQDMSPPVITSYSANIKDDELFYVSGRTTEPNAEVIVHLQSTVDGSSFDFNTMSDKRGDWTYRHDSFLAGGKYGIWAHTRSGDLLSPPSPQVEMDVKPIALNWGNSRITYQSLYIGAILGLLFVSAALFLYIVIHTILVRRRRRQFGHQLRQAEDSIKRGFIALRRDIEAELMIIKQAHLTDDLVGEQKVRQQQLEEDLKNIEALVGRELWEVESFEKLSGNS
ncbi:TPA: hypothetical protein DCG61_00215 [Patescibacteria group bacterium]|nr:hypothetical protein [Patescibacteria group bacterium]